MSCFGFRTQYGGGKSTGFALVYDSNEALKKFEPHFRLVRVGAADKVEKASRQQRMFLVYRGLDDTLTYSRQAEEEPLQEVPRYRQDQGSQEEQGLNVLIGLGGGRPAGGVDSGLLHTRLYTHARASVMKISIWINTRFSFSRSARSFLDGFQTELGDGRYDVGS